MLPYMAATAMQYHHHHQQQQLPVVTTCVIESTKNINKSKKLRSAY
jgi:hypothetical protein